MKRRNADCGKIRRPIKKNKIAEQIGSNTLLYFKFLLLWAFVITADFLLEFRFEFLWPFWLLLRSIYDSYKYKGLAFSVLFVCIAVTSDLVCLFFIPVQWLFFAASTYVWVQYVWHTDKGVCLPTIILWLLFVYVEAARWKDSRNIPHLNLCRPFAAHCIGYPVVTLGFGFKSYVGYRIRQRKQREVAKDNDFYMQLLQEALPKEESIATLELSVDGATSTGDQSTQKELVPVALPNSNSLNSSSGSTTSSRSDTGHHNHHNHNHHHHNQHQQQQQQHPSKNAQSYKSSSNSGASSTHVNGHVSSGSSPSSSSLSTMNGGVNHVSHQQQQQSSSKHRKSLDKDSGGSSNATSTSNSGSKMNGGSSSSSSSSSNNSSGVAGNFAFHQATTFQQSRGSNATSSTASNTSTSSSNGGSANSTKEGSTTATSVGGSIQCNGGTASKDSKEGTVVSGLFARKDHDKEANGSSSSSSSSSSGSTKHGSGQSAMVAPSNRSKNPIESGTTHVSNKTVVISKQNGHVSHPHQTAETEQQQQLVVMETTPVATAEAKAGGRSGRKNRIKKTAEQQANLSAIAKLCATLALASSVTTLTTTTATSGASSAGSAGSGGDKGTTITVTSPSYTGSGYVSSSAASTKDNHQHNGEYMQQDAAHDGSGVASDGHAVSSPPVTTVLMQKVCESCPRFEGELKKLRSELASHRQTENEMRQKYDSTTNNLKGCMQTKQKEYDELQNRYQELSNQRQQERQNLQTVERRLGEERRHRQSLEAQLNNERKYRKQAEEKAARSECGEACKMKKQQMELELEKMQHELLSMEEAKLMTEKQARNYEQEMRKMELQVRSREAQQNTEVLMSALAAMQDKNATLEKNLSAETRVKLDLFSALGGIRREVEILTCSLRSKEKEILDLNAKIVQLVAVMPTMPNDALCLTGHGGGVGADGGGTSMMRLADAPQLLPQSMTSGGHLNGSIGGPGNGSGAGVVGVQQQQQQQQPTSPMSHLVSQNGPSTFCSQLASLGVLTSTMTTLAAPSASSVLSVGGPNTVNNGCGVHLSSAGAAAVVAAASGGHIVQMQNVNSGGGGVGGSNNCPGSGLDPNATIYTPKNNGMVGGTEA